MCYTVREHDPSSTVAVASSAHSRSLRLRRYPDDSKSKPHEERFSRVGESHDCWVPNTSAHPRFPTRARWL
eukprot:4569979-Prymnesium_polylepis.2